MKRAVITSAEGAGPHFEAIDVIRAMADLAAHSRAAMRDVFDHFDRDKDGVLDREDLLLMIRQLIPSLSVQERCYLIENLVSFGNPAGRVTYQDIKRICVLIGAQTSPMGSGKAIRGWPSAVHTSVATIHSSDFSKSGQASRPTPGGRPGRRLRTPRTPPRCPPARRSHRGVATAGAKNALLR